MKRQIFRNRTANTETTENTTETHSDEKKCDKLRNAERTTADAERQERKERENFTSFYGSHILSNKSGPKNEFRAGKENNGLGGRVQNFS